MARVSYRITDLVFVEVSPSVEMYTRGYEASINDGDMAILEEITNDSYDQNLVAKEAFIGQLSRNGVDIVRQSTTDVHRAPIINGWQSERFAFSFVLATHIEGSGTISIEYVTGFTDICDTSEDSINPDTTLFITGVVSFIARLDPQGMITSTQMLDNFTVGFDETSEVGDSYSVTRPAEVSARISAAGSSYTQTTGTLSKVQLMDNSMMGEHEHVGTLLSASLNIARSNAMLGNAADNQDTVTGELSSNKLIALNIFRAIYDYSRTASSNLLLSDLNQISEIDIEPVVYMLGNENVTIDTSALPDAGSETFQPTFETTIMNSVLVATNELMGKNALDSISFTIDNSNGYPVFGLLGVPVSVIEGFDAISAGENMVNTFIQKKWDTLTHKNEIMLSIEVYMLGNASTISVGINGGLLVPFIIPNAAHAKIPPILLNNNAQELMGEIYKEATDCISGVVTSKIRSSSTRMWQ